MNEKLWEEYIKIKSINELKIQIEIWMFILTHPGSTLNEIKKGCGCIVLKHIVDYFIEYGFLKEENGRYYTNVIL